MGMALVGVMLLATFLFPSIVIRRKEDVGICGCIVYLGETQAVGNFQRLGIYTRSTYYIYVIIVDAMLTTFIHRTMAQSLIK